ncbi:MAG: hypothetical protein F6K44_05200, partial [Moorea sp. SIO3E2]|nr:hypothetical protein [Moorena sp. SIO3E2]
TGEAYNEENSTGCAGDNAFAKRFRSRSVAERPRNIAPNFPESKSGASSKSCLTQQWCVTGSNLTLATRPNMKAPLTHPTQLPAPYSRLPTPDSLS